MEDYIEGRVFELEKMLEICIEIMEGVAEDMETTNPWHDPLWKQIDDAKGLLYEVDDE